MGFGLSSVTSAGASLKGAASGAISSVVPGAGGSAGAPEAKVLKLEKAVITCCPTGESLTVAFNPSEYVMNREAYYAEHKSYFGNTTHLEFKSVRRRQMEITLFFDTTDTGKDVSEQTKVLEKFMDMIPQSGADPAEPVLSFQRGKNFKFICVLEDLTMRFTKFDSEGNPLRVSAKCIFTEFSGPYKEADNGGLLGDTPLGDTPLGDALDDSALDMSFDAVPAGSMLDDSSFTDISFDNMPDVGSLGNTATGALGGLTGTATGALGGVAATATGALGGVTGAATGALGGATAAATGALGGVTGAATGALNGVTGDLSAKASGLAGGAMNSVTSKASGLADGAMNSVTSKVSETAGGAMNSVTSKASDMAGSAMNSATSKASDMAGSAMNSATSKAGDVAGEALGGIADKVGNIDSSFFDGLF